MNQDGGFNVLDIVALANCILAGNCGDIQGRPESDTPQSYAPPPEISESVHRGMIEKILGIAQDAVTRGDLNDKNVLREILDVVERKEVERTRKHRR